MDDHFKRLDFSVLLEQDASQLPAIKTNGSVEERGEHYSDVF